MTDPTTAPATVDADLRATAVALASDLVRHHEDPTDGSCWLCAVGVDSLTDRILAALTLTRERDKESDRWRSEAEEHHDLRAGIAAEAAGLEELAKTGESMPEGEVARRLRALLDGPTPAPNTTQPYADLCRAVVAVADETMRLAQQVFHHSDDEALAHTLEDLAHTLEDLAHRTLALVPDVPPDAPSSPTADVPAPGGQPDTTETQEAAQTCRRCGAPITRDDWRWIGPDRRSSCADGPLRGKLHTPETQEADRG